MMADVVIVESRGSRWVVARHTVRRDTRYRVTPVPESSLCNVRANFFGL